MRDERGRDERGRDERGVRDERDEPMRSRAPEPTPPAFLDPILAVVERIERRRRHIRPIRPDGVLGVERRRHRGREQRLADGTRVRRGDSILDLHLDNRRVSSLWASGWRRAFGTAIADLRALALEVEQQVPGGRPIAVRAGGLLAPASAWLGFEVGPPRMGWIGALEGWYLRGLLVRWNPEGRTRLRHGHHDLRTREAWLSTRELVGRYGRPGSDVRSDSGSSAGPDAAGASSPDGSA